MLTPTVSLAVGAVLERSCQRLAWRLDSAAAGGMFAHELRELHAVVSGHHLRRLFANHDRRCIRVPADHVGHDARIRHTQLPDAHYPESWIDDAADAAGARQVVHGQGKM